MEGWRGNKCWKGGKGKGREAENVVMHRRSKNSHNEFVIEG